MVMNNNLAPFLAPIKNMDISGNLWFGFFAELYDALQKINNAGSRNIINHQLVMPC